MVSENNKKPWIHEGGGCSFVASTKFSCEDSYRNVKTGKVVEILSTPEAHFNMPERARRISDLTRRKGVSKKVQEVE